jgi:hypothetical protein
MKSKLSLSFAFATILMASSFSAFADQPQKFKVDHNARHDSANHTDAEGVTTLWTTQQFKMLGDGKMVPLGAPKTNIHVAATDKMHAANPNIEKDVAKGLADDPATLSIFSTLASAAGKLITTGISAVKSLVSKPAVQDALLGGAVGIGASIIGGVAGSAAQAATAPSAPAPVPAQ